MGFQCGIVGLPNVGKSTLFNALTATSAAEAKNYPRRSFTSRGREPFGIICVLFAWVTRKSTAWCVPEVVNAARDPSLLKLHNPVIKEISPFTKGLADPATDLPQALSPMCYLVEPPSPSLDTTCIPIPCHQKQFYNQNS